MQRMIDDEFLSMLESKDLQIHFPMSGLLGGTRRSNAYGSSVEFADYREYTPGDDLRRIDWNLYARFEKLYLRLTVDERQLHHRIYIDSSASMAWGGPSKGQMALKLAAALSFLAVRAMDRVSLYTVEGNRCRPIGRAFTGQNAFYEAVEGLNRVRFRGEADFEKALLGAEEPGRNDGLTVLLSDFLSECNIKNAVEYLCRRGREVCLLQVLSREEAAPGLSGEWRLLDSEAGRDNGEKNVLLNISKQRKKAYKEACLWYQKDLKTFCDRQKAGFLTVLCEEDFGEILFRKATEGGLIQ